MRVAILGDSATQRFVPLLRTLFYENGVDVSVYEGPFDASELEVFNTASGSYDFRPDVIVLANCTQTLRAHCYRDDAGLAQASCQRPTRIWDALTSNISARLSSSILYYRRDASPETSISKSLSLSTPVLLN